MRNLLLLLICFLFCTTTQASEISQYVNNYDLNNAAIYILDKNSNKVLYSKNEKIPQNPASLLKPITFKIAYDVLGKDYEFKTSLYLDQNKNAYIKLGGDVLLTQSNLNELISHLKGVEINNIFIDDTIIDKDEYPHTWLKEDKWPRQRAITPYIIDRNYTQISIVRSSLAKKIDVIQNDEYKIPIINELQIGDVNKIKITQPHGKDLPIVNLEGTIDEDTTINIPVLNPEINFNVKLIKALNKNEIIYYKKINARRTPSNATMIASVGHSLKAVSKLVLHNSDNLTSEVVSKVAAAKYYKKNQAGFEDAINMFYEFYPNKLSKNEKIADASGVSRHNFLSPKTISIFYQELSKNNEYISLFQTSHQGTMTDRLLFLKNNLKVKTGTMRQLSAFCGIIKTRKNNEIIFTSIVQDAQKRKALLKNFENTLIGIIYKHY